MRHIDFLITLGRLVAVTIGLIVFLMWAAGSLGLADFRLEFTVPEIRMCRT